jgi:hypothetical protein
MALSKVVNMAENQNGKHFSETLLIKFKKEISPTVLALMAGHRKTGGLTTSTQYVFFYSAKNAHITVKFK